MYYLAYGLFYLFSLLPFWLLYLISNGVYLLLYYVIGYRRKVVMYNLSIAFPEKTIAERTKIAKQFYHNLVDTFLEVTKFISISKAEIHKRFTANFEVINNLHATGKSVQIHSGHFFNWEFANYALADKLTYPFVGVYMPIKNKAFEKLFRRIRTRFGTHLIPATNFKNEFENYKKKQFCLGLVGDQNPGNPMNARWTYFFTKKAPFITGPEKGARANDAAVVFCNFYKVRRGYYKGELTLVTTNPRNLPEGEITKQFVSFMEESIRKRPSNYLWSHRRWKHEWKEEYEELWLDGSFKKA